MDTAAKKQRVEPVIRATQYTDAGIEGDFSYMMDHPSYEKTLFVFNENVIDMLTSAQAGGAGNACVRPFAWPKEKKKEARSVGIPKG